MTSDEGHLLDDDDRDFADEEGNWKPEKRTKTKSGTGMVAVAAEVDVVAEKSARRKKLSKKAFEKRLKKEKESKSRQSKEGTQAWLVSQFFVASKTKANYMVCRMCNAPYNADGGASNLTKHLRKRHGTEFQKAQLEAAQGKDSAGFVETVVKAKETRQKRQTTFKLAVDEEGEVTQLARQKLSLVVWLINCQLPFNSFESNDWARFAKYAKITVDSAYLMKQTTRALRDVVVSQAEKELSQCSGITVTADLWTSVARQKYLVITYHGLKATSFEFVHHVLDLLESEPIMFDCRRAVEHFFNIDNSDDVLSSPSRGNYASDLRLDYSAG
jgi:hypothetical protein